jgi:8-oxo-dGTP pyrophosphatase MutT (NUDIX family)
MEIRAAGGVVWRREGDQVVVAVIHRPRHGDWSLPKGKLDDGEDELAAAVREVREEIGADVEPGEDLGTVGYRVRRGGRLLPKTVRYWAMRYRDGAFAPNAEVDEVAWLTVTAAAGRLSYTRDRDVLLRFAGRQLLA